VSIHGVCGPDWTPGFRDHPGRGIENVELEIGKPSGPWGREGDDLTPIPFSYSSWSGREAQGPRIISAPPNPRGSEGAAKKKLPDLPKLREDYDRRGTLIEDLQGIAA